MVCGDHSDVTVSVKGQEFRLHRGILAARNSFFSSKLNSENQRTIPSKLSVDDCDPAQFQTLVHYIYTGMVDNLCPENVCGLYEVADTYQEQQMKAECLQFMMNTLSVDNFCDYTTLALRHDQEELFQKANDLFMRKVKEIIRHDAWKNFLEKYPVQANKLYLKALDQDGKK